MGPFFRRLQIKSLKTQIEASRLFCASLADELHSAQTEVEKARITTRYNDALGQNYSLQLLLDWLERKEREQAKPHK